MRFERIGSIILGAGLAFALVACGDDGSASTSGTGGSASTTGSAGEGGASTSASTGQGGDATTTATTGATTTATTGATTAATTGAGQGGGGGGGGTLPTQAECTTECAAAQAGNCTVIMGDCSMCCGALLAIAQPSGCSDELSAYYACVSGNDPVCNGDCTMEQNGLVMCAQTYCLGNLGDPSCQTLLDCGNAG
jgi:hypothetical protein